MSIAVRGTLVVDRKNGRHGSFNVGDLATEIGEFEVKDALIEEFEPGRYEGLFTIAWIAPDSFTWRGRVFVKNRATLENVLIDDADEEDPPAPVPPPEPDPVETTQPARRTRRSAPTPESDGSSGHEATATRDVAQLPPPGPSNAEAAATSLAGRKDDDDAQLFGEELHALVIAGSTVKLDPTVDRLLFRQQRDRLKALGFGFDSKQQTWSLPTRDR